MLRALHRDHRGRTAVFYLDVSLPETLRRHVGRPQAAEFTMEHMRGWYIPHDLLGVPDEQVIDQTSALDQTVAQIGAHFR